MKRSTPYKVYALDADGNRSPLGAYGVVVELQPGIEVELEFAPHPNFAGQLILVTPATARMEAEYRAGNSDDFSVIFGAANVLHVFVERQRRKNPSAPKAVKQSSRSRSKRG